MRSPCRRAQSGPMLWTIAPRTSSARQMSAPSRPRVSSSGIVIVSVVVMAVASYRPTVRTGAGAGIGGIPALALLGVADAIDEAVQFDDGDPLVAPLQAVEHDGDF